MSFKYFLSTLIKVFFWICTGETGKDKFEAVSGGMDCLVKVWNLKVSEKSMTPVWTLAGIF